MEGMLQFTGGGWSFRRAAQRIRFSDEASRGEFGRCGQKYVSEIIMAGIKSCLTAE
jgi:hypothetical protein